MPRPIPRAAALLAALALSTLAPSHAAELEMAFIHTDSPGDVKQLAAQGVDIAAVRSLGEDRLRVEAVLTRAQREALEAKGYDVSLPPAPAAAPRALARAATAKSAFGWNVYTSFDEPDVGMRDRIYAVAERYPRIAKLQVFGHSIEGRELLAVRLGARNPRHRWWWHRHRKPEVLIVSTHHAREWAAAEMGIRLLEHLASSYGSDERITALLDRVNVWLVPIANPDGYEFTFTDERLWRKNLRDVDGDGTITVGDGVDLNRNFGSNWGLNDEGSSPSPANNTYRGTAPFSEPENEALRRFMRRHRFKFAISYHTYGNLILYPLGWQVQTPSFDDGIFVAQAGVDGNAAIVDTLFDPPQHYDPGVSADLYITNGDFTDWAYAGARIPNYTVELTAGSNPDGSFYGFVFPDDEQQVQTMFEDNLDFALSLAESALDPANPVSPVDMPAADMYHDALTTSRGHSQPVTVVAKRRGRWLRLYYSVDGGRERRASFRPRRGEFYNDRKGIHYDRYQAVIRGQKEGSEVTYRIVRGREQLGPFTYTVDRIARDSVLVLAAEDNVGNNPVTGATEPVYLGYYTDALDELGVDYDVWNLDETAAAPPVDAVLSHYDAVVWYSGDDFAPEAIPGFRGLIDNTVAIREYFNYYDGRLFATGQDLPWLATQFGFIPGTGQVVSDDFFQYYLGAFIDVDTGGVDEAGSPFDVVGEPGDPVFGGLAFSIQGGTGAGNQATSSSFLPTPQFQPGFPGVLSASYARPGSPFDPFSGDFYVYSNQADVSYKRLGGEFTLPAGAPQLTFMTSFEIETAWDFAFVEVSVVGSGEWTTLPDANGLTATATGQSCASGWVDQLHPHLANYMDAACNPTGSTGAWHAMTGNSGGWKEVSVDLSAYAGQTVELYITYASDWGTQGLGMFIDDVTLADAPLEDFESGSGDWQVSAPPAGSANAQNNWERISASGFSEGPAIRTDESVLLGFGFEAVDTAENRTLIMQRVLDHLRGGGPGDGDKDSDKDRDD